MGRQLRRKRGPQRPAEHLPLRWIPAGAKRNLPGRFVPARPLEDGQKGLFLQNLLPLLHPGGRIYIGDVAFATRAQLEACKQAAGEEWDIEEFYFVYEELKPALPGLAFTPCSFCAGVLTLG